ncbi:MAG TPA: hypothetical protein DCQ35_11995, partial [Rhodospirillum rubrum]|nr:hypothetical protein [Rhodospirillum rubrum]
MSRLRFDIEGKVTALSPLHVGTGDFTTIEGLSGKAGANAAPQVARIARDAMARPMIPSTALKGVLLTLARSLVDVSDETLEALFGTIKAETGADDEPSGRMGAVTVFSAYRVSEAVDVSCYPYGRDGCFVAARTSIDGASGVAANAKLFHQEMVAPGTTFGFRCRIEARGAAVASAKGHLEALLPILSALTDENGVPVGKGQADGFGRLRLDGKSLKISQWSLDGEGRYKDKPHPVALKAAKRRKVDGRWRLGLTCEGPFAVLDGSYQSNKGKRDKSDKEPNARAQSAGKNLPLILGSSLSGALRSRAVWLENLRRHRAGAPLLDLADNETPHAVNRLFGRTDFRGLLAIEALTVTKATEKPFTSVKIDRFSGAPIDNALVTTQAFIGVRAVVTLSLIHI